MKRTALITIASLLAIIASIFTFSYFQKGSIEPQNTINTTVETQKEAQTPETTPEVPKILESDLDTSTWKTYRNDEFGFEIKHPDSWIISPEEDGITLEGPELREKRYLNTKGENWFTVLPEIQIIYTDSIKNEGNNVSNNLGATTLKELIERHPFLSKVSKIQFAGQPSWMGTMGGDSAYLEIFSESNGHLYEIWFGYKATAQELTDTEKQILNSFSFTR